MCFRRKSNVQFQTRTSMFLKTIIRSHYRILRKAHGAPPSRKHCKTTHLYAMTKVYVLCTFQSWFIPGRMNAWRRVKWTRNVTLFLLRTWIFFLFDFNAKLLVMRPNESVGQIVGISAARGKSPVCVGHLLCVRDDGLTVRENGFSFLNIIKQKTK